MPASPSAYSPGTADDRARGPRWNLAAALAAWLVPGLGHILIGRAKRGVILMVTIGMLWSAGLVVGGISVIDSTHNRAWFLGQMLVSPSVIVDQIRGYLLWGYQQEFDHRYPLPAPYNVPNPPDPAAPLPEPTEGASVGQPPPFSPAFGRVQEQAVLYTALAGLLNLLAILDVVYRDEEQAEKTDKKSREKPSAGDTDKPEATTTAHSIGPLPLALAYRFLLDPLPVDQYWLIFLIPLGIAIAVVYKTIRVPELAQLPRQAAWLSFQIIAFMLLAAMALWLVTELA